MNLGQVYQSLAAWRKLSAITMKAKVAYRLLKYTECVSAEYDIVEKQRVALIREATGATAGENARIEPNTKEFVEYAEKLGEIMLTESTLDQVDMELEDVINVLDNKSDVLTVSDLALLAPFFRSYEVA
ncbi:hypothetical protein LCGC14_2912740 [marine sediment metagenome]|uniref:Uncharacterized protein n=1 Tax=marine sediment metagenome TaxID=412755 RepID=A0A0F9AHB8_9ZZZZ